ncbi:8387_t:CDS:2 [Entrophospora sp. SA101]|nr:8387_t:CDS:2 [Entrophospora sp. SA101]
MLAINFNTLTDLYHDAKDLDNGLCVILPFGELGRGDTLCCKFFILIKIR